MAFMEKVRKGFEWLEHGKTVVDILIALGVGKGVSAGLRQWTKLSAEWIAPIWLLVSATLLWLLMKYWPIKAVPPQQSGQSGQLVVEDVNVKLVEQGFNSIDHRLTGEIEQGVRGQMQKLPAGDQRDTFLVRGITALICVIQFEITWYNIFASQILALQQLNGGNMTREAIFPYYTAAAHAQPHVYSGYSFDQWLAFMRSQTLLKEEGAAIVITVKGRAFLKYLVDEGRSAAGRTL